jgi:hypothetical protein
VATKSAFLRLISILSPEEAKEKVKLFENYKFYPILITQVTINSMNVEVTVNMDREKV